MKHPLLLLISVASLAACDVGVESRRQALPAETRPLHAQATAPLVPNGPVAQVRATGDAGLQQAAQVSRLDDLTRQGDVRVKIFSTLSGDRALNGQRAHIAFFRSPAQGWRIFPIGEFLDYRIRSETPGRVDLEVEERWMDAASQRIMSRKRRMILAWRMGEEGAPPERVAITPAR